MSGSLAPRLVLVTRETDYEQLLVRHATRGQANAFLRQRAQTLEGLDAQRERMLGMLTEIRAAAPKGWRIAMVRRAELDRFLFGPEDVVVAVGQDGLVANLAKYLTDQPVIGVNADPTRNPGILVPHTVAAAVAMLPLVASGQLPTEGRTMVRAELDDGQALLALNEIFVGHASHQSARYNITYAGREEAQSSSGLIVASGTGATGWALSISRATGVAVDLRPDEAAAVFLVREPWPSQATGVSIGSGRLKRGESLLIVSRMNEGGVVFADGMEGDRLDFAWGRTLRIAVAERQLRFVPGKTVPGKTVPGKTVPTKIAAGKIAAGAPSAKHPTPRPVPQAKPLAVQVASGVPPAKIKAAGASKGRRARRITLVVLFAGIVLIARACAT